MSAHAAATGRLAWEVTETATGTVVHQGQRDLGLADVEVMVRPVRPAPRLGQLRRHPRRSAADALSWLVYRGRPHTSKRVRLGAGFWLVLPEHSGPGRPSGTALQATREGQQTSGWEWFDLDESGATATKRQETGTLGLEWVVNRDGYQEVVSTVFVSDVSLRVMAATGSARREPVWRVRVLAGSAIRWPQAADGIRLVPHLRPDHPRRGQRS